MYKLSINYLLFILFALCFGACSDTEEPEIPADADENFITAFTLTRDGKTYEAKIDENKITISVPYTVNLENAVTAVVYTPSATILPDPATITEWDNEQIFRVTSYNGDTKEYTYRAVKEEVVEEGDVELKTAAEITAFAKAATSVIKGNLVIGTDDGEEITSIEGLSRLKQVSGNLILKNSFKVTDLTGLDNVTTLGGLIVGTTEVVSTAELNLVTMKSLTEITGDVLIRNNSLKWMKLDALKKIGGTVTVASTAIESLELPVLTEISGGFDICGITEITLDQYKNVVMGGAVTTLAFPELTKVGGIVNINYLATLTSVSFRKLATAGGIEIQTLNHLFDTIDLSALTTVEKSLKLASVRTAGKFASDQANNKTLKTLGNLSHLQTVGDSLKIDKFSGMTTLPTFSSLKTVRVFYLGYAESAENNLDLSGVTFPENGAIVFNQFCSVPSIIGKGDMPGDMIISTQAQKSSAPNIKGFTSVKNLLITMNPGTSFDKTATMTYEFERITGNVEVNYRLPSNGNFKNTIAFPSLKEVGGNFALPQIIGKLDKLSLPVLETIGGKLTLKTRITTQEMPNLKSVDGQPWES